MTPADPGRALLDTIDAREQALTREAEQAQARIDELTARVRELHEAISDLQSPIMALACLAEGASYIRETIFDGRYTLVGELNKMGARVEFDGTRVVVHGPSGFKGARVVAHDLRTGIALILAGLAASGETIVTPGYPIDRGHASIAKRFNALGADITAEG